MAQINFALDFASRKAKNSLNCKRNDHQSVKASLKARKEKILANASTRCASSTRIPQDMVTVFRGTEPVTVIVNPRPYTVAPIHGHESPSDSDLESPYAVWVEYYLSKLPPPSGGDGRSRRDKAIHKISAHLERVVSDVMQIFDDASELECVDNEHMLELGKSLVVLGEAIREVGESCVNEAVV